MSKTIALVACVKSKSAQPKPAKELYTSTLFKGTSAYAREVSDQWFILSAKYGLLKPDQIIAPYEKTLNTMPAAERRAWAQTVIRDLRKWVNPGDEIIFLAGKRYREYLIPSLERIGCRITIPMEGLTFGKQLSWLKDRNQEPNHAPPNKKSISTSSRNTHREEGMSLADQIRDYALRNFIETAREAGKSTVEITAREVHKALGLKSRYPGVCSALDGKIFKEQAKVVIRSRTGPERSSTVVWTFEIL